MVGRINHHLTNLLTEPEDIEPEDYNTHKDIDCIANRRFKLLNGRLFDNEKYGYIDNPKITLHLLNMFYNDNVRYKRRIFQKEGNKCENCHHFNSLIHWSEGEFQQCMRNNKLWRPCKDYDPIEFNEREE